MALSFMIYYHNLLKIPELTSNSITQVSCALITSLIISVVVLNDTLADDQIFAAEAVAVDVTARTATEARERGLREGRVRGLRQVYERLVMRQYHDVLPKLAVTEVIDMVRDFTVLHERTSAIRYMADINVRFHPDAVRTSLRFSQIPFAETISKPILVLPLYQESIVTSPVLWEEDNPWREAWEKLQKGSGLVPIILPYGDLQDIATLSAEDIFARAPRALSAIAERYKVDGIVIASATVLRGFPEQSLQITITTTRAGEIFPETSKLVMGEIDKDDSNLFTSASQEVLHTIEDDWKQENLLQFGMSGQITVLVPIKRLDEWLEVRRLLETVAVIDRHQLQAITQDRAQVILHYIGDQRQLQISMEQSNLNLTWDNDVWTVGMIQSEIKSGPG